MLIKTIELTHHYSDLTYDPYPYKISFIINGNKEQVYTDEDNRVMVAKVDGFLDGIKAIFGTLPSIEEKDIED